MVWDPLIEAALAARENSYSPYSRFAVGAAVLTARGNTFAGCNLENRSFGISLCAERVAVGCANAAGERELEAIAILADANPPARPCGLCLDTLAEFNPRLRILLANLDDVRDELLLSELLTQPFRFQT